MSSVADPSPESGSAATFVKRAAALRAKYPLRDITGSEHRRLMPAVVVAHPANRNGVRINGERCEELFRHVFRKFDFDEAAHGAVCVELVAGSDAVRTWHRDAPADDRIASLPLEHVLYASIGASHINQVLRNVIGRAVVGSCVQATDAEGRLSLQLVHAHDSALAEACRNGLRWEVLSQALEIEEPFGVMCIQAALNDPANAMMVMHEMQVIRQLASVCALEGTVSSQASVATVRARLSAVGFPVAECANFEVLLEFVTLQGAYTDHRYVDDLVDFHQLLVNPRVRRLRDCHFRHVCSIKSPCIRIFCAEGSLCMSAAARKARVN